MPPPVAVKNKGGRPKKQVRSISSAVTGDSSVKLNVETAKSKKRRGRPKTTASQLLNDDSFNLNVLFDGSSVGDFCSVERRQ